MKYQLNPTSKRRLGELLDQLIHGHEERLPSSVSFAIKPLNDRYGIHRRQIGVLVRAYINGRDVNSQAIVRRESIPDDATAQAMLDAVNAHWAKLCNDDLYRELRADFLKLQDEAIQQKIDWANGHIDTLARALHMQHNADESEDYLPWDGLSRTEQGRWRGIARVGLTFCYNMAGREFRQLGEFILEVNEGSAVNAG